MELSRRALGCLIPVLVESSAFAQTQHLPVFSSKVFENDQIPYKGDETKKGRRFLDEATHAGFEVEVHETILGPGMETHPPHKHEHEEIIIVVEGTLTVNMDGNHEAAPAGSVITFGSNQTHNARNVGTSRARYYVVELRGSKAS